MRRRLLVCDQGLRAHCCVRHRHPPSIWRAPCVLRLCEGLPRIECAQPLDILGCRQFLSQETPRRNRGRILRGPDVHVLRSNPTHAIGSRRCVEIRSCRWRHRAHARRARCFLGASRRVSKNTFRRCGRPRPRWRWQNQMLGRFQPSGPECRQLVLASGGLRAFRWRAR